MTTTASNVEVAVTGEVSFAPAGSTLPTDATTALDAAFAGLPIAIQGAEFLGTGGGCPNPPVNLTDAFVATLGS